MQQRGLAFEYRDVGAAIAIVKVRPIVVRSGHQRGRAVVAFRPVEFGPAVSDQMSFVRSADDVIADNKERLAHVDDEGVTFKSHIDGSMHRFTPEVSMQVQHQIGAIAAIVGIDQKIAKTAGAVMGQPVQQFRMSRRNSGLSEVTRRRNKSPAKMKLPQPVHDDSRSQRVLLRSHPFGQRQSAAHPTLVSR